MTHNYTDFVSTFQLDGTAVRGRAVKVTTALQTALRAEYPEAVARLLGDAMMLGALVTQALKFDGRLVVQCHGTNAGAISLLIADCQTNGDIRGYARWDDDQLKMIELDNRHPGADVLLGGGTFSMTIDQGPDMDQYQGLASIEGNSLADCAEHYFKQSEQIPTRVYLACGQAQVPGEKSQWCGGGIMLQRIAPDDMRDDTDDMWETAKALFETLSDEELVDPDTSMDDLLYRLFHEQGVRVTETSVVSANCTCSEERLRSTLQSFDNAALIDMAEEGVITANCEFCGSEYVFKTDEFENGPSA